MSTLRWADWPRCFTGRVHPATKPAKTEEKGLSDGQRADHSQSVRTGRKERCLGLGRELHT
jgi:hypothetical protein